MITYLIVGILATLGVYVAIEKKDEHTPLWVFVVLVLIWPSIIAFIITDIWEKLNKK